MFSDGHLWHAEGPPLAAPPADAARQSAPGGRMSRSWEGVMTELSASSLSGRPADGATGTPKNPARRVPSIPAGAWTPLGGEPRGDGTDSGDSPRSACDADDGAELSRLLDESTTVRLAHGGAAPPRDAAARSVDAPDLSHTTGGAGDGEDAEQGDPRSLLCAGLAADVTDDELEALFAPFGTLVSATLALDISTGESRGFGFVAFARRGDGEKAMTALHGRAHRGGPLRVVPSMRALDAPKSNTIFVRNLPLHITLEQARRTFEAFGGIIDVRMAVEVARLKKRRNKFQWAVVEYRTETEAAHAIKKLHLSKAFARYETRFPLIARYYAQGQEWHLTTSKDDAIPDASASSGILAAPHAPPPVGATPGPGGLISYPACPIGQPPMPPQPAPQPQSMRLPGQLPYGVYMHLQPGMAPPPGGPVALMPYFPTPFPGGQPPPMAPFMYAGPGAPYMHHMPYGALPPHPGAYAMLPGPAMPLHPFAPRSMPGAPPPGTRGWP